MKIIIIVRGRPGEMAPVKNEGTRGKMKKGEGEKEKIEAKTGKMP